MNKTILVLIPLFLLSIIPGKLKAQTMNKDLQAQLLYDAAATLGEGAIWNHEQQVFWWVDIEKGLLNIRWARG